MTHWILIVIIVEAMVLPSWITAALTRQLKFAFVFALNEVPAVACPIWPPASLRLASSGCGRERRCVAGRLRDAAIDQNSAIARRP
jgi:hypothetical protein